MNDMKIIDILNMIAKRKDIPKRIIVNNKSYFINDGEYIENDIPYGHLFTELFYSDGCNEVFIDEELLNTKVTTLSEDILTEEEREYCPICGRKLGSE